MHRQSFRESLLVGVLMLMSMVALAHLSDQAKPANKDHLKTGQ